MAFEYGLRKKKSIEESLDDLASFIAVPEKREYETNDLQEQNDYLRQENEDLRSGLEITTQEVEEFRNNISLFREEEKSSRFQISSNPSTAVNTDTFWIRWPIRKNNYRCLRKKGISSLKKLNPFR